MLSKQYAAPEPFIALASKQLQTSVVLAEHLAFTSEAEKAQLTVLSADGVALGKAMLQLFEQHDLSKISELTITVDTAVDLQFLLMYLVAPPSNFHKRFVGGHINIQLRSAGAVRNMASMLTTTDLGRAITLPEVFGKTTVSWEIAGSKEALLRDLERSCHDALRLFPQKSSREPIIAAFKDVVDYLNEHKIVYLEQQPQRGSSKMRAANIQPELFNALKAGEVVYASSDETLHLFISGTTLNIIDPGNLATPGYVREILKQKNIEHVNIMLTHMHTDHTAALLQVLKELNLAQVAYKVNIPEAALYQFSGFVAAHREELSLLNINRHIKLLQHKESLLSGAGELQVFSKVTKNLRHFIPNASYGFIENKHLRYFSGDINTPPPPSAAASPEDKRRYKRRIQYAFTTYFRNIFLTAKQQGVTSLELFTDFGHFSPQWQAYMRATIERMAQHYDLKNYAIYEEHFKQTMGTTEARTKNIPRLLSTEEIITDIKRRFTAVQPRTQMSIAL